MADYEVEIAHCPSDSEDEDIAELTRHLNSDPIANMVLKGHLLIEEKLTAAIEEFVFNPSCLDDARLTFAQKLAIYRSLSPGASDSSCWDVIAKLNKLRNALSHSLDGERRVRATESLIATYKQVDGDMPCADRANDEELFGCILAFCLGFISGRRARIATLMHQLKGLDDEHGLSALKRPVEEAPASSS